MWMEVLGGLDSMAFYIMCAVSAVNLVLALGVLILGCILRTNSPGSSMDFYISLGGLTVVGTLLLRGIDPAWDASQQYLEVACQFFPSILIFGMLWLIGGLLLRCCTIHSFYMRSETEKVHKHEWKPNLVMIVLMLIDAALVLVWLFFYGLELKEIGDQTWACEGVDDQWWQIGISAAHAFYLILAAIMIWPAIYYSRKTPTETDANLMSVVIYNMVFCATAGALVFVFYETSDSYMYAILGGLIQYVVFITLLLLLVSKILTARRSRSENMEGEYSHMEGDKHGH